MQATVNKTFNLSSSCFEINIGYGIKHKIVENKNNNKAV